MASMRGAEKRWRDVAGLELIVGPLRLLWVVAQESNGGVIPVKYRDSTLQFRDQCIISMKAHLARAAQMLRDGTDKLAVKIEVAQAAVLAIAHQHQRLVIARVH